MRVISDLFLISVKMCKKRDVIWEKKYSDSYPVTFCDIILG